MSYHGQSPRVSRLRVTPLSADPINPAEGDLFYSDGTPRDEGLWVYTDGAWEQFSTGAAISTLPKLTLTPQSSDPVAPDEGTLFISNGTPRAEGLWQYMNGDWVQLTGLRYQEFSLKVPVSVRVATTAALTLASQVESGDTIDGVVLATNDLVLVKNQTTASENGVYVVQASGSPIRHTSADTFSELNNGYSAFMLEGTTNKGALWFQTSVLTSLSDNQVWSQTPANYSFVVPEGVYSISVFGVGAGAGGGGGGGRSTAGGGGGGAGGGGGGGGMYSHSSLVTTPGETLTLKLGAGGAGGKGGTQNTDDATKGGSGSVTQLLRSSTVVLQWYAGASGAQGLPGDRSIPGYDGDDSLFAAGGAGGNPTSVLNNSAGGGGGGGGLPAIAGGGAAATGFSVNASAGSAGCGGGGGTAKRDTSSPSNGGTGGTSEYQATGAAGGGFFSDSAGGGGGGASYGAGGVGGAGASSNGSHGEAGAGGGGGGGSSGSPTTGGMGGCGGHGFIRISW